MEYIRRRISQMVGGASSLDFHGQLNVHLELSTDEGCQNADSLWYFGEGPNSSKSDKTDFNQEFTTTHFSALATSLIRNRLRATYWSDCWCMLVREILAALRRHQQMFTQADTPDLAQQSSFITGIATIQLDLSRFSNSEGLQLEADDSQFFDKSGHHANFHLLET
jgi:hypothetical protein